MHVLLSPNLSDQDATILVVDDGDGMDTAGLRQHWLIGISKKRRLKSLPQGRQQIGKFGIGKLATYVLASRLTHISKRNGKFYSTSMNYGAIDTRLSAGVEPDAPIKLPVRRLTEAQAKRALRPWTQSASFRASSLSLFGASAPSSWTVAIMSSLKPKVHEIKPGTLKWVLSTALPLRPDFAIWLDGKKLAPSKHGKGVLRKWTIGKDLVKLPKPAPKGIMPSRNENVGRSGRGHYGIDVPGLGRVSGYAEAYEELLTGNKSDQLGRSHGFFVYVFGRLLNVFEGHFGIPPDELRHGTFGRMRIVVHMDGLDADLRSNREAVSAGPLLETAQDVLRAIFNAIRPTIEYHDAEGEPGVKLARKLAASPSSLSRRPIVELARAVVEGARDSRYLIVPKHATDSERAAFIDTLEKRAEGVDDFLTGLSIDYEGLAEDGVARFDTVTGRLRINAWHPFVATFYDDFVSKHGGEPLELLAMAEVLIESHMHAVGVSPARIEELLVMRDMLLRNLANESGRQSAFAVASDLRNARNNPRALEETVRAAFKSLGFDVTPLGKAGQPDGVARAHVAADGDGKARSYAVSLEAKSKQRSEGKVSAKAVGVSAILRQRDQFGCDHAVVVGPAFPTSKGEQSALCREIDHYAQSADGGHAKTVTLITIDALARLVRLRPVKQLGLLKMRELFQTCRLPSESDKWVETIRATKVKRPPYRQVVTTIAALQQKYRMASVKYAALRVELSHLSPAIEYETDDALVDLCKAMAQMAPGAMFATSDAVELDQSAENVIAAIDASTKDYPIDEQ